MLTRQEIAKAYENKILGIRNYKSSKKEFSLSDLTNPPILGDFIVETLTGESDITPAGKSFLEKYYGFKNLAADLLKNEIFKKTHSHVPPEELQKWLEGLVPMEITRFVEESKGTITENATVRSDLLPPENL